MRRLKKVDYKYGVDYTLEDGTELYTMDWNGEKYTNGFKNGKDTNETYIPVYNQENEVIGFED